MLDLEEFLMLRDLFNRELSISENRQKNRTQPWNGKEIPSRPSSTITPRTVKEAQQIGWLHLLAFGYSLENSLGRSPSTARSKSNCVRPPRLKGTGYAAGPHAARLAGTQKSSSLRCPYLLIRIFRDYVFRSLRVFVNQI